MLSAFEYKTELRLAYLEGFRSAVEAMKSAYEEVHKNITSINKICDEKATNLAQD